MARERKVPTAPPGGAGARAPGAGGSGAGARPRRFWLDPRFAIGIVLIAASVAGTVLVVAHADTTVAVLAARDTLIVGDTVAADDLVETRVRIDQAEAHYLTPGDLPGAGLVVTRTVAAGELVPATAVGASSGVDVTSVVVGVGGALSAAIEAGDTVDVWAAAESDAGDFGAPAVIVPGATVAGIISDDGLVVDNGATSVELLVPRARVARLLEAIANEDAIALVPASMPAAPAASPTDAG